MKWSFSFTCFVCSMTVVICVTQNYQKTALAEHNRFRQLHNSQSVILDGGMSTNAEKCALDYAQRNTMDHKCEKTLKKGENIYLAQQNETPEFATETAMDMWYKEKRDYSYEKPDQTKNKMNGHFTQMVWNKSVKLGCGVKSASGRTAAVCLYDPPGNVGNGNQGADYYQYYKENVKRLKK